MRTFFFTLISVILFAFQSSAQERVVKVDFETSAFQNVATIPFDQPFLIEGQISKEIEYVKVDIYLENGRRAVQSFSWNRREGNDDVSFSMLIPSVLTSNSEYDFEITTYKLMSKQQKQLLAENLRDRVAFYLRSNFKFDGKRVTVNEPKKVFRGLEDLIDEGLKYQISKNNIHHEAPSELVLNELQNQSEFKFKSLLKNSKNLERDSLSGAILDRKIKTLTDLAMSEIMPYLSSDLVQQYKSIRVNAVSTDKEPFSLPVNGGLYAWTKEVDVNNVSVNNTNFTPGFGFTIPFSNRSTLISKSKLFDSFGYSMGVLIDPIRDASGAEFVTPTVNLPVYAGLGFRLFKVVRLNGGVIVAGEKGAQDFNNLNVVPTVGLALELNLWMGVKK